jgi:hypothetical protein
VYLRLTSDHDDRRNAGEDTILPPCHDRSDARIAGSVSASCSASAPNGATVRLDRTALRIDAVSCLGCNEPHTFVGSIHRRRFRATKNTE